VTPRVLPLPRWRWRLSCGIASWPCRYVYALPSSRPPSLGRHHRQAPLSPSPPQVDRWILLKQDTHSLRRQLQPAIIFIVCYALTPPLPPSLPSFLPRCTTGSCSSKTLPPPAAPARDHLHRVLRSNPSLPPFLPSFPGVPLDPAQARHTLPPQTAPARHHLHRLLCYRKHHLLAARHGTHGRQCRPVVLDPQIDALVPLWLCLYLCLSFHALG